MNSRPLSATSPDPLDPECITPNHILKLKCVPGPTIPGEFSDDIPRKIWRYGQKIAEDFWKRWTNECLPLFLPRSKWIADVDPVREGDIVLLVDDLAQRNAWKKDVVTKIYPGPDGKTRVVDVDVPVIENGKHSKFVTYRRHRTKICLLGVNINDKASPYGREKCDGLAEAVYGNDHT